MRAHGELGFITLDAFSSDAIPIHLLTQEALRLYVSKLRPHGVLAFHISNKYLDLERVVGTVAAAGGLACYAQIDAVPDRFSVGKFPSHWVAMARSRADLGKVGGDRRWHGCRRDPGGRAWSDDYANVVGALK